MNETIQEKVSVLCSYNRSSGRVMPEIMSWQGKHYRFTKQTYYHKIRLGRNIRHIFHVTDGKMDFRLCFNADNLHWLLEEITDGLGG